MPEFGVSGSYNSREMCIHTDKRTHKETDMLTRIMMLKKNIFTLCASACYLHFHKVSKSIFDNFQCAKRITNVPKITSIEIKQSLRESLISIVHYFANLHINNTCYKHEKCIILLNTIYH